jgi:hypothetical protein
VQEFGNWIGVGEAGLLSVAGEFPDATRWSQAGGNRQRQSAARRPGVGIFAKGHLVSAVPYFMHMSLRITPSNPLPWRADDRFGRYFREYVDQFGALRPAVDVYGNISATIGGGPLVSDGHDTTTFCLFNSILEGNPNRPLDQTVTPSYQQRLALRGSEDDFIERLFLLDSYYDDHLKYECIPDDPDEFNSNSYTSGLLSAAGIAKPWFPQLVPSMFPGWNKPVPAEYFQP